MNRDAWHYFVCIIGGFAGASLAYLLLGDLSTIYADITAWLTWFGIALAVIIGGQLVLAVALLRATRRL